MKPLRRPQRANEPKDVRGNAHYSSTLAKLRRHCRRLSRYITNRRFVQLFAAFCILTVASMILRQLSSRSRQRMVSPEELVWLVGVSRVDITPTERVWLSGFSSRNRTAESAIPLDPSLPLYARVVSLRPLSSIATDASPLVIVALDLIGLDRAFSDRVHAAAFAAHGLRRESLHLIVSHTHSGPVVGRNLAPLVPDDAEEWAKIERYADFLLRRILAAIAATLRARSLVPAAGRFVTGKASLGVNRRQVREAEFDGTRRGETDDAVPIMWFTRATGDIVVGLYGYAAHATVLTSAFRYSGDYPAFTSDTLERKYPGSRWLFLPGCGGDQNIYPRGSELQAKQHASALGRVVATSIAASRPSAKLEPAILAFQSKHVSLPFEKRRDRNDLRHLQRSARVADRRAATELLREVPALGMTREAYDYPIAAASIGGKRVAFLGGEPTVGFCHTLRERGTDWVVGYCDDVMGYVATEKARKEGGREGSERAALYYGLPAAWKAGAEYIIVDAVQDLEGT